MKHADPTPGPWYPSKDFVYYHDKPTCPVHVPVALSIETNGNGYCEKCADLAALLAERDDLRQRLEVRGNDLDAMTAERDKFRSLTFSLLHRLTLNGFTDCAEMIEARAALAEKG